MRCAHTRSKLQSITLNSREWYGIITRCYSWQCSWVKNELSQSMNQTILSYSILLKSTKIADTELTPVLFTMSNDAERKSPIQARFTWLVEKDFWRETFPCGSFLWLCRLAPSGCSHHLVIAWTGCTLYLPAGSMLNAIAFSGLVGEWHHGAWYGKVAETWMSVAKPAVQSCSWQQVWGALLCRVSGGEGLVQHGSWKVLSDQCDAWTAAVHAEHVL